MPGLAIPAYRDGDSIALSDLLDVLGGDATRSSWTLHDLELAPSPAAERIYDAISDGSAVPGNRLRDLAVIGLQVIDGILEARAHAEADPWVSVRAVDGSWWDVVAADNVLRRFQDAFPDAKRLDT
jgi:hypothetical protein